MFLIFLKQCKLLSSLLFYAPPTPIRFAISYELWSDILCIYYENSRWLGVSIHVHTTYSNIVRKITFFLHNIWKIFIAQTLPLRKVDRVTRIQYIYVYVVYIKLYTHIYIRVIYTYAYNGTEKRIHSENKKISSFWLKQRLHWKCSRWFGVFSFF